MNTPGSKTSVMATALILVMGFSPFSLPVRAAQPVAADGTFYIRAPFHNEPWEYAPPFPIDRSIKPGVVPFLENIVVHGPPWDPIDDMMFMFADESGKVRVAADTGPLTGVPATCQQLGLGEFCKQRKLETELIWKKTYVKGLGAPPKFTVNGSTVAILNQNWYAEQEPVPFSRSDDLPYAGIEMVIYVHWGIAPEKTVEEFWARLELGRDEMLLPGFGYTLYQSENPYNIWLGEFGHDGSVTGSDWKRDSPLQVYAYKHQPNDIGIATESYTGTLDVGSIGIGQQYTVEYQLSAEAGAFGLGENWSSAFIGDPLDASSGLTLETTDIPVSTDEKPVRLCDVQPDSGRYLAHGDGTLTDTYTGLMWQRCPLGYLLDESGTPGFMDDDRCTLTGAAEQTWQLALQLAADDASAAYSDWRLPNIKELDSIVELGCHAPAIESGPFPDTPTGLFWSSTPGRDAVDATGVSFLWGDIRGEDKTAPGHARLVRTGPQEPVQPLAALRVGRPEPLIEGDAGSVDLVFPVALDRPALTDVSVHYATQDGSAQASEDYTATSGTLTIPAGSRTAQVNVPVLGDTRGEANETFYVVLDGVSANARLVVARGVGEILNDEPLVEVARADVYEGDSGSSDLAFLVTLNKPSLVNTTVNYATADGTASGSDYTATSGTVTIPAGQTAGLGHVNVSGDTAVEHDEYFSLTLTGVSANAWIGYNATAHAVIVEDDVPVMLALNDTGYDRCTDGAFFTSCPQAGWPGQDAEFGRDVDPTKNTDSDGTLGFSLTKLDAAGVPLADQSQPYTTTPWSCVRDEVTGLVWEIKTADGGLHDQNWHYTWYNSTGLNDGGKPGTANGASCFDTSNCDTEKFVAAVNSAGLCGASDWRLPNREELRSLAVATGTFKYLGDRTYFPNSSQLGYWTSTPAVVGDDAWIIGSNNPSLAVKSSSRYAVRLVRGGN